MDYLQNHIWCSKSNWDGSHYDCRHLVSLKSYEDYDKEDWDKIVTKEEWFDENEYINATIRAKDIEGYVVRKSWFMRNANTLKPEVIAWLNENVEDRNEKDSPKGWCIGDTEYRATDGCGISIFFHRRKDAMKFIKQFSVYKKPVFYCQYFKDIRKRLNLETMKYEEIS